MARLFTTGFELNTTTAGYDFSTNSGGSVSSTTYRSGSYSFRTNPTSSGAAAVVFRPKTTATADGYYIRAYVYVASYPSANDKDILTIWSTASPTGTKKFALRMSTTGVIHAYNYEDSAQVGNASDALSLNTWYRLELKYDCTTLSSTAVEVRLNGASFATGTINLAAGLIEVCLGTWSTDTYDMYWDDFAINDDSGSFQTSWPDEGSVITLIPNANGDNSAWTGSDGNSTDNYALVTDIDDATYVQSNTANQIDDYNLGASPAELASTHYVNLTQVNVRFAISSASGADPDFVARIKASASGTVEESGNLSGSGSTTYYTNTPNTASPYVSALTTYDLPGASTTAWSKTDIDNAQIGVRESVTDTHYARVSGIWLTVDFTKPRSISIASASTATDAPSCTAEVAASERNIGVSDACTIADVSTGKAGNAVASTTSNSTVADAITTKAGNALASVTSTSTVIEVITTSATSAVATPSSTTTISEVIVGVGGNGVANVSDTSSLSDSASATLDTAITNRTISVASTSTITDAAAPVGGDCLASIASISTLADSITSKAGNAIASIASIATINDLVLSVASGGAASVVSNSTVVDNVAVGTNQPPLEISISGSGTGVRII